MSRGSPAPEPDGVSLVGPLAGWELVRLARRGQALHARLMVVGLLAVALTGVAVVTLSGEGFRDLLPDQSTRLGERFVFAAVLAQLAAVILVAPGYAAAAVAEEKERRTLETLLSTPLADAEIVRAKFLARAAFVLSLVLAGLPVVAAVLPFGGADPISGCRSR